jgi:hypothetical protein
MKWKMKFPKPIKLSDGRVVDTLDAARTLIRSFPDDRRENPRWRYADELIEKAADYGERYAVMDARAQLERAFKMEGLL